MFDPAKSKVKKAQKNDEAIILNQLRAWCYELVPQEYHMNLDIDIKEIECLDPSCAPIDSVFTFVWGPTNETSSSSSSSSSVASSRGGLGLFSLPFPINKIERSELAKSFPVSHCT